MSRSHRRRAKSCRSGAYAATLTSSKEQSRPKSPPPAFYFYLDRPFKPTTFLVVQPDGDRIFDFADEFERGVVIVAENFMSKRFI
jgi:hypothetical protein